MKILKKTIKKAVYLSTAAYVGVMAFTMQASAQFKTDGKLSDNAVNVTSEAQIISNQALLWFFFGGFFLASFGIFWAYRALKDDNPQSTLAKPIAAFFVGLALMLMPEIIGDGIGSIFGDGAQQGADADDIFG